MLPHAKIPVFLQYILILLADVFAIKLNERPKISYALSQLEWNSFAGNESMNVYLRLLYMETDTALIGGRNVLYNVSLNDLSELKEGRIEWNPVQAQVEMCTLKGGSEVDCDNYIRVAAKINDTALFVCGTSAFKPLCQLYRINETRPVIEGESSRGEGKCPFGPRHNSTMIFAGGHLYSATAADFSGNDPVIYREPLRTEQSNSFHLNAPNFVGSISYQEHVYFFFREPAVEHMNCGKVIYSRVARVCKSDKGGPIHLYKDRWTSFLKARLNCSIPGEYPFYFDEIEAISDLHESEHSGADEHVLYGVFNTPANSIGGSAICAFSMRAILDAFNGPFKEQKNMDSNWLPVPNYEVPDPRPGSCVKDSRTLRPMSVNFVKSHPLMDEAVHALHSRPVFLRSTWSGKLSAIAVDPKVETVEGRKMDVLFVGADDGLVLKLVTITGHNLTDVRTVFIEEIKVFEDTPIRKLTIARPTKKKPSLLIMSDSKLLSIPLERCSTKSSCKECVALQDPYCAWHRSAKKCVALRTIDSNDKINLIQNVTSGLQKECPRDVPIDAGAGSNANDISNDINSPRCPVCENCRDPIPCSIEEHRDKIAVVYITDTMGLLIGSCVLVTLIVGFAAGYMCSRHFRADSYSNVSLHPNHQLNRLNESSLNSESGPTLLLPPCSNNKAATMNLVLNSTKNANDKNSTIDNKTLQKVQKTYI